MLAKLKILLIIVSLLMGSSQIISRLESLLTPELQLFSFVAYGALFGLCLIGILGAAFIPNTWIRWALGLLISLAGIMVSTYERTTADHMPYDAFINMVVASGAFHEAWGQHAGAIIFSVVQAGLLVFGIGLDSHRKIAKHARKLTTVPFAILMILVGILFMRGGEGVRGLPASYTGAAYSALYGYERMTAEIQPREKVKISRTSTTGINGDIVLIIDESISGQYLDINSPDGIYSGLMAPKQDVVVHNFGFAASISHCSAAVNYTLRHGGTREAYREINSSKPAIWSYAKKAGMETIYIDVPRTGREFNNQMNEDELQDVDQWVQFDDVPIQVRDHAAADALAGFLNDGKPQFIYLNKIGAHFPIHDKYPDRFLRYRPALPRGQFLNISDTGDRDGFSGSQDSWVRYRNAYRNTLLWNVGAFFDRLFSQAELSNATIIYTSDHGQNLHERGGTGVITHCSPDPQPEEGLVPLVVLQSSEMERGTGAIGWAEAAANGKNKRSHFQIFPTLLDIMDYDQKAVEKIYGANLFAIRDDDPFSFNYQFNARFGRSPQWKKIDLKEIANPPVTDYSNPTAKAVKKTNAAR